MKNGKQIRFIQIDNHYLKKMFKNNQKENTRNVQKRKHQKMGVQKRVFIGF